MRELLMKTLVIVAHPNIENSKINKRWIDELNKYPERFTVHELYNVYPNDHIDVEAEQALIEAHDDLILQFPIYWFSCPPLLKKWFDEVFIYGWAYGSKGTALIDRRVRLAISTGIRENDYSKEGRYHFSLEEILRPFEVTMHYIHANYQPFFAFYGSENNPGVEYYSDQEVIEKSAKSYIKFLNQNLLS